MKKYFAYLLGTFLCLGMAAQSWASARVDALATDVREVEDIDLIWLYPNKVLDYKNTVDFRLNSSNGVFGEGVSEWGGVIVDMGDDLGVWGTYVNRPAYSSNPSVNLISIFTVPENYYWYNVGNNGNSTNILDLFWAKKIGDLDLGVHFNYGETPFTDQNFALGLGLGLTVPGFSQANVHVDYAKDFNTTLGVKDNGIYTFRVGSLWAADLSPDNSLRLFGDLNLEQYKPSGTNAWDTAANLGASLDQKVFGGKGLVSTGIIFDYWGQRYDASTDDIWSVFWNGSFETKVADWLTLRAGLVTALLSRIYYTDLSPVYQDNSFAGVSFNTGFGINWENLTLDGLVATGSFENSINDLQPGRGLLFSGNMFAVTEADLRYKF